MKGMKFSIYNCDNGERVEFRNISKEQKKYIDDRNNRNLYANCFYWGRGAYNFHLKKNGRKRNKEIKTFLNCIESRLGAKRI